MVFDRPADLGADLVAERPQPAEGRAAIATGSPAFTLETHGHLIDGDLGPALDLRRELPRAEP
jgi:hypothetical protein